MVVMLGAGRGVVDSRPDYDESADLARRLREQQFLVGQMRTRRGLARVVGARESDVLVQGLSWGIGLSLGFWLALVLVCRQLF